MVVNMCALKEYASHSFRCFAKDKNDDRKKNRAHDTKYSYAVSHPSTNSAKSSLTAAIGREPVFSRRYGREHLRSTRICFF